MPGIAFKILKVLQEDLARVKFVLPQLIIYLLLFQYILLSARRERTVTARSLQNQMLLTTGSRVIDQTVRN